jgi:capsular exopolysaccharide synthesis family protein
MAPIPEHELKIDASESRALFSEGWKLRVRTVSLELTAGSPLLPFDGRDPQASEQYRIIRTKILQYPRRLGIIAVSSPQLGDGKSVTAVNLAGVLALKNEIRILLVDADFRRSVLAELLDTLPTPGLAEVLTGEATLDEAVVKLHIAGVQLYFLPAGRKPNNPAELLASSHWPKVCAELRNQFDYCVIDTPPVGIVADYDLIQPLADGIVVVVRPDHTSRARCSAAFQSIPKEKLVGVISNCQPDWFWTRSENHDYLYYRGAK